MYTWIHQHLRCGLDIIEFKSFQSADTLHQVLSEHEFGLSAESSIEHNSHIFNTLYYRDILKYIQFL